MTNNTTNEPLKNNTKSIPKWNRGALLCRKIISIIYRIYLMWVIHHGGWQEHPEWFRSTQSSPRCNEKQAPKCLKPKGNPIHEWTFPTTEINWNQIEMNECDETFTDNRVKSWKIIHINLDIITEDSLQCIISIYSDTSPIVLGAVETHQVCLIQWYFIYQYKCRIFRCLFPGWGIKF